MVNLDDPYGARLADELRGGRPPLTPSRPSGAEAPTPRARGRLRRRGLALSCVRARRARSPSALPLPGHFNVENALAALAACRRARRATDAAAAALADAGRVPGRFEPVDAGQPFAVLVDYAHTPDSLENVLRAARKLTAGHG